MGYTLPNGAHINTNSLALIEALHAKIMAREPIVFEDEWDGIRCLRILWHPDDEPWWEKRWEREGINGWGKGKPELSGRLPKLEVVTDKRRWWQRLLSR
jgi:hypothetical protein